MNKTEFYDVFKVRMREHGVNLTKDQARYAVNDMLDIIGETMAKGEDVKLVGFGTFTPRQIASREGFNPASRKKIMIPDRVQPRFRAGNELKEMLNRK